MSGKHGPLVRGDTVFVLGAGVDAALGLPLMNTMFKDLHAFAKGEGRRVDKAIRKHVKIRFSLATYAGEEGEDLGEKLLGSHVHLLPLIQQALTKHPSQNDGNVKTLRVVIGKLQKIADANSLKEETVSQLQIIAGDTASGMIGDTLLDTAHIALQPVARQAMRKIFMGVLADMPPLDAEEKAAFEVVVAALSNFEEMLGDFFTGYFTKNPTDQKRYFYLSWLLWAYVRDREREGFTKRSQSFYQTLSEVASSSEVITFNYTDFFIGPTRPRDGYFHGDSRSYIRFDKREYISDNKEANGADTVDKIAEFIEGLPVDWTGDAPRTYLPAIVPPLSVKPIICTEYLERWYACGQLIKKAKAIVLVGYSFNVADEHFNDLIRKQNHTAKLLVINPSIGSVIEQVCRIIDYDKRNLDSAMIDGLECMKGGRLIFVKARAEEITTLKLMKLLKQ